MEVMESGKHVGAPSNTGQLLADRSAKPPTGSHPDLPSTDLLWICHRSCPRPVVFQSWFLCKCRRKCVKRRSLWL